MNSESFHAVTVANFNELHAALPKVAHDAKWANGTGYFDGAASSRTKFEQPCASVCPKGRKIIIIPNKGEGGNIVIFQRYHDHQEVLVAHYPKPRWLSKLSMFTMVTSNSSVREPEAMHALDVMEQMRWKYCNTDVTA